MAKRIADKELTDRNWDEEDETEEAGTFSVAPADVLKTREIKKAKRRNPGSESEVSGAFKGFKGLVPSPGGAFSAFGNGSGLKTLEGVTNGTVGTPKPLFFPTVKTTSETKLAFGSLLFNGPSSTHSGSASTAKTNGERTQPTSVPGSASNKPCSSDYNKQLTSLNCSVRDWIVKHVNTNPLCDLTPIFRDYEKHLSSIEQKYGNITDSGSESDSSGSQAKIIPISGVPKLEKPPAFTFSSKENPSDKKKDTEEKKPQTAPSFNFGQKVDSSVFSVGAAAGFSFSSGVGFGKDTNKTSTTVSSFPIKPKESSGNSEDAGGSGGGEEEEEPPKVVINEVKEEDAFYSKKCKLFYKKDTDFKERGVGTLHLKLMGNQKTQLLVRADTNLGNIMLNILVQPSMPCSRTGKNNVIIVCVPNPPVDEKNPAVPVTMLIRVKTTEDADELHRLILEKKEM